VSDSVYQNAPPVSEVLLEYLEGQFPDMIPRNLWDADDPTKHLYKALGWREVLDHLRSVHDAQNEDD